MPVARGEIVEVAFPLPGGAKQKHPTLVVSNNSVYQNEGSFVGVMLSGKPSLDNFSFELLDNMVTKTPKKKTQVRCHLLAIIDESEITSRHGSLKLPFLDQVADKICKDIIH